AVDVLHDQVRLAQRGAATVEQSRDVGVNEAGEDLALLEESPQDVARGECRPEQLDRDLLLVLTIIARGQIHTAGLALADLAEQLVGSDAVAERVHRRYQRLEKPVGLLVGLQQRLDLAPYLVVAARLIEEGSALVRLARERELEQPLDRRLRWL